MTVGPAEAHRTRWDAPSARTTSPAGHRSYRGHRKPHRRPKPFSHFLRATRECSTIRCAYCIILSSPLSPLSGYPFLLAPTKLSSPATRGACFLLCASPEFS